MLRKAAALKHWIAAGKDGIFLFHLQIHLFLLLIIIIRIEEVIIPAGLNDPKKN